MTNEEAEAMRKQLSDHLHSPVLSLHEFCTVFKEWLSVATPYLVKRGYLRDAEQASTLFYLAVGKSSLLGRMLYGREKVRTVPCPECKGEWSGCFLKCPCGGCGWLPNTTEPSPSP